MVLTRFDREGNVVLKWWPVIAFALIWFVSGMLAYSGVKGEVIAVKGDVSAVKSALSTHEKGQADQIGQIKDDIKYIRDRLDKALDERKKQ